MRSTFNGDCERTAFYHSHVIDPGKLILRLERLVEFLRISYHFRSKSEELRFKSFIICEMFVRFRNAGNSTYQSNQGDCEILLTCGREDPTFPVMVYFVGQTLVELPESMTILVCVGGCELVDLVFTGCKLQVGCNQRREGG